jgi:hypothetical protein
MTEAYEATPATSSELAASRWSGAPVPRLTAVVTPSCVGNQKLAATRSYEPLLPRT